MVLQEREQEIIAHRPGTPSWCDVSSPDLPSTLAFYGGLFGWEAEDMGEESGHYTMLTLRGKNVAGAGPRMDPSAPVAWTVYISVEDADATVAKVAAAGGTPFFPPMDVFDSGRMAIVSDNAGAVLGLWQPRNHIGAQLMNVPNTLCWAQLAARDVEAARSFYGSVFGWSGDTRPMGEDSRDTNWTLAGNAQPFAGMGQMNDMWPAEAPPHWMPYFAVEDCDATAARAVELGGTVYVSATDIDEGRFAMIRDPHGANFAIIQMKA